MDQEKYNAAKTLEQRIEDLKWFRAYISNATSGLTVRVSAEIFGVNSTELERINTGQIVGAKDLEPEDRGYLIRAIDERITELEEKFKNL